VYLVSLILINYLISMPLKELFKVLKMLYCSNPLPKTQNPKPRAVPDGCDVNLKFSCAQKWLKRQNLLLIMIANVYL